MISDSKESIVVEPVKDKVAIYDNPIGVLTNNPTFDKQLFNLNNYRHLSPKVSDNLFSKVLDLDVYSRGMGGIGLPGDLSSMSRFVKVAFTKLNAVADSSEASSVNQFFHILKSVEQRQFLKKSLKKSHHHFEMKYWLSPPYSDKSFNVCCSKRARSYSSS